VGDMIRARAGALAILAVAAAYAWPMQGPNGVQNAHYALVRALASGTTHIDRTRFEVGEASTNDISRYHGHIYSNKAPGLAILCTPLFKLLQAAGGGHDPSRTLWVLGLLGSVAPAVGLSLLVRIAGERIEPGYGLFAAVALGLGTIVFPYATVFLSHALSAFLVFAAFMLLWLGPPRALAAAAAGLAAGYAVTTEYPNATALVLLGLYLLTRGPRLRRAGAFAAGAIAGILPLLVYDWAAFGSPFRLGYTTNELPTPKQFYAPSLHVASQLVLGFPGLVPLAPVVAAGVVGMVLAWRRGFRREIALAAAVSLTYLTYNSAFYSPFGGYSPGPRYLITTLPFLLFAIGPLVRALPLTSSALALISVMVMTMIVSTHALAGYDGRWLHRLRAGDVTSTAASLVGVTGAIAIVPLFLAVAASFALGASTLPFSSIRPQDVAAAGLVTFAWAVVAATAPGGGDAAYLVHYVPSLAAIAGAIVGTYALRKR
jgi:hypothetical protein